MCTTVIKSHCILIINLTVWIYLIVDLHWISQHLAVALCHPLPQSSILGRLVACFCGGVNQTVLWRQVLLRGEGRNDTSLKWYQFSRRQAALQCGRRIWQKRHRKSVHMLYFKDYFNVKKTDSDGNFAIAAVMTQLFLSVLDVNAASPQQVWFTSLTCHKIQRIISKILVICIRLIHLSTSKTND